MQNLYFRQAILALTVAALATQVQAAPQLQRAEPILVERHLEIKDPAAPVGPPVDWQESVVYQVQKSTNPLDDLPAPDPRGGAIQVGF